MPDMHYFVELYNDVYMDQLRKAKWSLQAAKAGTATRGIASRS